MKMSKVSAKSHRRYVGLVTSLVSLYIAYSYAQQDTTVDSSRTTESVAIHFEAEGYPTDRFTVQQLRNGAIVLHIIGLFYMFLALAIVCDEFFVPVLEVITEKLQLSPDVAGATFMAAGGSAPELFTNVAGVLIVNSPVGFGTVVGSAVFNILFVIGACSFFSKTLLVLTWWPLFRDVVFYSASLVMLIFYFNDGAVSWWESALLIAFYAMYALFMKYNEPVEAYVSAMVKGLSRTTSQENYKLTKKRQSVGAILIKHTRSRPSIGAAIKPDGEEKEENEERQDANQNSRNSLKLSVEELNKDTKNSSQGILMQGGNEESPAVIRSKSEGETNPPSPPPGISFNIEENVNDEASPDDDDEEGGPLDISWPEGKKKQIKYLLLSPIILSLWFTLPDVRRQEKEKFVIGTFIGSIAWIGAYSYLMVWWAIVIGQTFYVNDTIMGLTFLAAGTSVPDLMTSVIVARKGFGDMAVSSSVGSNLFDITIGLPVPWLIFSLYQQKDYVVNSEGLFCSVMLLFLMLILVVVSIAGFGWKMHKGLGLVMIILYIMFLIVAIMLEQKFLECPNVAI